MVVYNHHFKRYALMILDVYMVETRRMNEVNMTERITAIRFALPLASASAFASFIPPFSLLSLLPLAPLTRSELLP